MSTKGQLQERVDKLEKKCFKLAKKNALAGNTMVRMRRIARCSSGTRAMILEECKQYWKENEAV